MISNPIHWSRPPLTFIKNSNSTVIATMVKNSKAALQKTKNGKSAMVTKKKTKKRVCNHCFFGSRIAAVAVNTFNGVFSVVDGPPFDRVLPIVNGF
jgi:hypothetical protein